MFVFGGVHSNAASGHIANVFGGGKAGMKEQIGRLAIAHSFALFRGNRSTAFAHSFSTLMPEPSPVISIFTLPSW
jgi:hypothetical protein